MDVLAQTNQDSQPIPDHEILPYPSALSNQQRLQKVLYLSAYDPHIPATGAGRRGMRFVDRLSEVFAIDLIYLQGSGQKPDPTRSQQYRHNLTQVQSKTEIPFSQFGYFIWSNAFYQAARQKLQASQYDWILCDYGLSVLYGNILSQAFKIPLVYCSHNVEFLTYWDKGKTDLRRLLLLPYVYWAERRGVRQSDILVAITPDDAAYYQRHWVSSDKIIVIPQGFDSAKLNPFYPAPINDPKVVLFCGHYGIQQNREAVSMVYRYIVDQVVAEFPNVIFRFVGANPPTEIQHPNMEFTGFVDDYYAVLKQSDIFISPIIQGRGFPTKMVEALACGKPTIATPIGARAIERDYASLHICDLDEFAAKICQLLRLNQPVTDVDFEKVEQCYSWERNIQVLIDQMYQFPR